jgi:hypothetical protein
MLVMPRWRRRVCYVVPLRSTPAIDRIFHAQAERLPAQRIAAGDIRSDLATA